MQYTSSYRLLGVVLLVVAATTRHIEALEARGNPAPAGRPSAQLQKQAVDKAQCGTVNDLAKRVEVCAQPIMNLIQGSVEKWPRTDDDAMKLCESFGGSERCTKDAARKCGKGIQKTIISTVGTSIGRVRKRECSKAKLPDIVKTTMCLEKNQQYVQDWMRNVTGRLTAIETQTREGEKKVNAICCMVADIEREIKSVLSPFCPAEGQLVNRIYRAILEDVLDIVCRNPKCNNYMRPYKVTKVDNIDGIVSIILRIVFSLDNGQ